MLRPDQEVIQWEGLMLLANTHVQRLMSSLWGLVIYI